MRDFVRRRQDKSMKIEEDTDLTLLYMHRIFNVSDATLGSDAFDRGGKGKSLTRNLSRGCPMLDYSRLQKG